MFKSLALIDQRLILLKPIKLHQGSIWFFRYLISITNMLLVLLSFEQKNYCNSPWLEISFLITKQLLSISGSYLGSPCPPCCRTVTKSCCGKLWVSTRKDLYLRTPDPSLPACVCELHTQEAVLVPTQKQHSTTSQRSRCEQATASKVQELTTKGKEKSEQSQAGTRSFGELKARIGKVAGPICPDCSFLVITGAKLHGHLHLPPLIQDSSMGEEDCWSSILFLSRLAKVLKSPALPMR